MAVHDHSDTVTDLASNVEAEHCADGCCTAPQADRKSTAWRRAAHRARLLSWVSLAWMTGEGVLGLIAGLRVACSCQLEFR